MSTIYNTDINSGGGSALGAFNNAGTNTATILRTENGRIVTHTVAYPTTAYYDYKPVYSMCGTFPTSIDTNRTCVTAQQCTSSGFLPGLNTRASSYSFPSHPPIADGIQPDVDMLHDPKGQTYVQVIGQNCSRPNPLQALFPGLNLWSCQPLDNCFDGRVHPNAPLAKSTALYLTVTTTSTEGGAHKAPPAEPTPFSGNQGLPTHNGGDNSQPDSTVAAGRQLDIISSVPPIIFPTSVPVVMPPADAGNGPVERPGPSQPATHDNDDSPSLLLPTVVLDKTPRLPGTTAPLVFTVRSEVITVNSMHQYIVESQTLTTGGKIKLSGTEISLPSDETAVIVGDITLPLHPPTITNPAGLTLGNHVVKADSLNQYMVNGETLTPGGKIILSGTKISLPSNETALIVGDTTLSLQSPTITDPAVLTVGRDAITANSFNQYIIDGQTLTPGGAITVSGTRISLLANPTALVVGSITTPLMPTAPPALTIGTQTITANAQDQYIIDGQTLTPGGVISVSGRRISLAADKTDVVVGTTTEALGGFITSGLRGGRNESNPQEFNGTAERVQVSLHLEAVMLVLGLIVILIL